MTTFSDQDKLDEINRELEMRRLVYHWKVRNGKLSAEQARRQIDILIAIKMDYAEKVQLKPDPLFNTQKETINELSW